MDEMVFPTKKRPLDAIVDDIVNELGDVELGDDGGKTLVLPEGETRTKVRRAIEESTEHFHRWDSWHSREGVTAIANKAQKIADLVDALVSELNHRDDLFVSYLFTPPPARHTPMSVDDIMVAAETDRAMLMQRLERLRQDCERQQPPEHDSGPEQDRAKNHCAEVARNLMKAFSKRRITGTAEGPYRVIASLLYEALTGEAEVDLKRACDRALDSSVT